MIERFLTYQYLKNYDDVSLIRNNPSSGTTLQTRYGPPPSDIFGAAPAPASPAFLADHWHCEDDVSLCTDDPITENTTKDNVTSILLLNVQMYNLSHRFQLSKLMKLAVDKFMDKEWCLRYCHLAQVLSKIQEVTTTDDLTFGTASSHFASTIATSLSSIPTIFKHWSPCQVLDGGWAWPRSRRWANVSSSKASRKAEFSY